MSNAELTEHGSVVRDLAWSVAVDGDRLVGRADVTSDMWTPGTESVRSSVLATWADIITGMQSGMTIMPRIPITVDLELHVVQHPVGEVSIIGEGSVIRSGRSITVAGVEFRVEGSPEPFGFVTATFMASPDPSHVAPEGGFLRPAMTERRRLSQPLAAAANVTRTGLGTAEIPWRVETANATGAIQGGMVALCAEEAALSLFEEPSVLSSLSLRYLRAMRRTTAVAVAERHGDVVRVSVTDADADKLAVLAVARVSGAPVSGALVS